MGVLTITEFLKKYIPETIAAGATGALALVLVPGIMAAENWDDHDRSGRYTARDFGANYLKTCQPNGIIFTNGDNDTFPLWYNQEVEGVRTDVRVCNLSYLQTDWYIEQMQRKAYDSEPMPFTLTPEKYRQGTRDVVYLFDDSRIKRDHVGLKEAIDFIADDNPATKLQQADNSAYLPKKLVKFKIDKEAVIRNKVVPPEDYDKIVDEITINLAGKNYLSKDEMMILDLLATNNWERPIYWAITVGRSKYMNLTNYFQVEGFAYRFVPIRSEGSSQQMEYGRVATNLMYDNLMNKFEWGSMNNPDVYLDENNVRMMTNIRNSFNRLAKALLAEGKQDSAIAVIDRCNELIPHELVPYEYFAVQLADSYIKARADEKGLEMIKVAFETMNDEVNYYFSLKDKFRLTRGVSEELQRNMFYLQNLARLAGTTGDTELSETINAALQNHFDSFSITNQ
jgi:hypothetical protein